MAVLSPSFANKSARTYENAIAILERRRSLGRPARLAVTEGRSKAVHNVSVSRGVPSLFGMAEWLRILGHSEEDVNALRIIHIAGTKGKGSTCSFIESFLRAHAGRTAFPTKTGLYTSPHLMYPEERIRINFSPLSRELLASYFFEVYDLLPQLATEPDPDKPPLQRGPRYLQLWALLAFHIFIREGVDAVVMETHNGGENDATNVVTKPLVTAITTLGMDHVDILGDTIESIAWHKGGIFKKGAVALSTTQTPSAMEVLQQRAEKIGQSVTVIGHDPRLPAETIQLEPSVQRKNASLAAAATEAFLKQVPSHEHSQLSAEDLRLGVEQWSWPGRYQILPRKTHTWFLDAAHCELSVALAAQWFARESFALCGSGEQAICILIFSHMNKLRDARVLLASLAAALRDNSAGIQHVIFTTYDESTAENDVVASEVFRAFSDVWQQYLPDTQIQNCTTIRKAVNWAQELGDSSAKSHILVTGSQHLIGPALRLLQESE